MTAAIRTALWIASRPTPCFFSTASWALRHMAQPFTAETASATSSKSARSTPGLPITFMRRRAGSVRYSATSVLRRACRSPLPMVKLGARSAGLKPRLRLALQLVHSIVYIVLIEYVYEPEGSRISGRARRRAPFRPRGAGDARQPADAVGTGAQARGLSRRCAARAPAAADRTDRGRRGGRGARAPG